MNFSKYDVLYIDNDGFYKLAQLFAVSKEDASNIISNIKQLGTVKDVELSLD